MAPPTRRQALGVLASTALAGCLQGGSRGPSEPQFEDGPAEATTRVESPPTAGTWPMGRFDPAGTSVAPGENAPSSFPLERRWAHEFQRDDAMVPVVVDGTLLAQAHESPLAALDPATGDPRWTVPADRLREGTPVLGDGIAVVSWGGWKVDKTVAGYDLSDGERLWQVTMDGPASTDLVLVDDTVYVGISSGTASVLALATGAGELCFGLTLPVPSAWVSSLAVADGTVYVGTVGYETDYPDVGHVYAVDPAAGEIRWSHELPAPVQDVTVVDGLVFASSELALTALSANDGVVRWTKKSSTVSSTIAATPELVYLKTQETAVAFEAGDGAERWAYDFGGDRVVIGGDAVFLAGFRPEDYPPSHHGETSFGLAIVDAGDGSERHRQALPARPSGVSIATGHLFVGTHDGRILAYT